MKRLPLLCLGWVSVTAPLPAAISLGYGGSYSQTFDTLALSGTSSSLPTDWVAAESGTSANTTYAAGTGSSNTGDTYSFGSASSSDRALGGLRSGNVSTIIGASFKSDMDSGQLTITISYTGEQWRLGATSRSDRLDFQYSLNATSATDGSATWVSVDSLDFSSPTTTGTVGALNGNLSANRTLLTDSFTTSSIIPEGSVFWIRWTDFDPSGADDGLAIDDFTIIAVPETSPECMILSGLGILGILRRRR